MKTLPMSDILDALDGASYGAPASFELDDGRVVRLRVEIDEDADIRDDEFFGTFSRYAYDYSRDDGRVRPSNMDGNAEKLQCDRGSFVWWQPPADVPRSDPQFRHLRDTVLERLECGYVGFVVELCSGDDAYGHPIVVDVASLWGLDVDPTDPYGREVLADLIREVLS